MVSGRHISFSDRLSRVFRGLPVVAGPGMLFSQLPPTSEDDRVLYLTFDDGPGFNTGIVSRLLSERAMSATFFLQGYLVEQNRGVARELLGHGHSVGAHGHTHLDAWKSRPQRAIDDLQKGVDALRNAIGTNVRWIRPPFGHLTPWTWRWCRTHNKSLVLWNINPADYSKRASSEAVIAYVLKRVRPGSVVLLHEQGPAWSSDVASLGTLLDRLSERGFVLRGLPA